MLKGQSSRNIGGQFCYKEACRYMLAYFASKSSWDSSRLFITIYLPSIHIPQVILQWFYIYSSLLIFTFSKLRQKVTKPACSYRLFLREIGLFIYTALQTFLKYSKNPYFSNVMVIRKEYCN